MQDPQISLLEYYSCTSTAVQVQVLRYGRTKFSTLEEVPKFSDFADLGTRAQGGGPEVESPNLPGLVEYLTSIDN